MVKIEKGKTVALDYAAPLLVLPGFFDIVDYEIDPDKRVADNFVNVKKKRDILRVRAIGNVGCRSSRPPSHFLV